MRRSSFVIPLALALALVPGACDLLEPDHDLWTLEPTYTYHENGEEIELTTSSQFLMVRLAVDSHDPVGVEYLEESLGLRVLEWPGIRPPDQHMVEVGNAFSVARDLQRRRRAIASVGPVFELGRCLYRPSLAALDDNLVELRGEVDDPEVLRAIQSAGPEDLFVGEISAEFRVPWGDPQRVFDVANELDGHPRIDWARPLIQTDSCLPSGGG